MPQYLPTEFAHLSATGDPLADAVIKELHEIAGSSELLQSGLRNGLAAVSNPPPAIEAFLREIETTPAWVELEPESLRSAADAYMSVPPLWTGIGLTLALLHIYSSPTIAAVLASTGKLSTDATQRLKATGKWLNTAMLPVLSCLVPPGILPRFRCDSCMPEFEPA